MQIHELDIPGRKKNDPDITGYDEIRKKKTDPDSPVDSVVAHVKGKKSAYFTRLARRFNRAARIKKMLAAEEKKLKAETLEAVDEIFDATDKVFTRIVETASLVFKVAKSGEKKIQQLDQAGYLAELEKLSNLSVQELEELKQKFTSTKVTKVPAKVLAPKEKKPVKEDSSSITDEVDSFIAQWDKEFDSLESKIEEII